MSQISEKYINPYNFIPLGDGVKRGNAGLRPDATHNKTGFIDCTLTVKTPLAIPDTDSVTLDSENNHKTFGFYKRDGVYMIPGSQLRGMIRNVFEAVTDSCFSVVTSNTLSKRDGSIGNPGIVSYINGEWHLYNASTSSDTSCGAGVKRKWNVFPPNRKNFGEYRSKYYSKGEIVCCGEQLGEAIIELNELYDLYSEYSPNNADMYDGMRPQKDGRDYVVFYYIDNNNNYHLTPSQISRRIYGNRVKTLLDTYSPCADAANVCPACSLFGLVSADGCISSSVRFEDAVGTVTESTSVILKELSSPKLTSLEFYSLLSNDYNNNPFTNTNKKPWDYDSENVILRGRKFFFHNPSAANSSDIYTEQMATKRNSTMEIVKKGSFDFRVYFNNISDNELSSLLWVLTLGDNSSESEMMHKIGHGKPIGLGSVKIVVNSISERTLAKGDYSIKQHRYEDYDTNESVLSCTTKTLNAVKTMCRFNLLSGHNIAYPIGIKGTNSNTNKNTMQWFSINHGTIGKNTSFLYILHPVVYCGGSVPGKLGEKLTLPMLGEKPVVSPVSHSYQSATPSFSENKTYSATVNGTKDMVNGKIRVYITISDDKNKVYERNCSAVSGSPCSHKKGDKITVKFSYQKDQYFCFIIV